MSGYNVKYNDSTTNPQNNPISILPNAIDTSSSDLTLFGRGASPYGEALDEDLLHLLEHFASEQASRDVSGTLDRMRAAIANTQPAVDGMNPTGGQLWANKTDQRLYVFSQQTFKWDQLLAVGDVSATWGTITDGQTIPLPMSPTGYQYQLSECAWIVAPNHYANGVAYLNVQTNDSAVVTAKAGASQASATSITANYFIVGIKDSINSGDNDNAVSDGGASSSTLTVQIDPDTTNSAGQGYINSQINTQVTLLITGGTGPYTFQWSLVGSSGDSFCASLGLDQPHQSDSTTFIFSASSATAGTCTPQWRVTVIDANGLGGSLIVPFAYTFLPLSQALSVVTVPFVTASAQVENDAVANLSASISGGTPPYRMAWSNGAIDGSGAVLEAQNPSSDASTTATTATASYKLNRSTVQTVYTQVQLVVVDSVGSSASAFSTVKYNFIGGSGSAPAPSTTPLVMYLDGGTGNICTIEDSAYVQTSAGVDTRVFTLSVPVQVTGATNGSFSIQRLQSSSAATFNLVGSSTVSNATTTTFSFSISASQATGYPGTNADAWQITYTSSDGRTVVGNLITKFVFLAAATPLAVSMSNQAVTAGISSQSFPPATYVTLLAAPIGGSKPYSYSWSLAASSTPWMIVGPQNGQTLTLALRGTTFNNPLSSNVVWPAPTTTTAEGYVYALPVTVTVSDSTAPTQTASVTATASIGFTVGTTLTTTASYAVTTADPVHSSSNPAPTDLYGCWQCNASYATPTDPVSYTTFNRVSIAATGGSGSYTYVWSEQSVVAGSTLTANIVIPDASRPNYDVSFVAAETDCSATARSYQGVWRCDVTDNYTGATTSHTVSVGIFASQAASGSLISTIQKAPCNS